ncbi:histidine kinase [Flavobacterium sp. DG1-102-2]|uniref:sensor histidine kinase n=1 Tax=Flavobacterium sp. DG1-102-2 TaxID=3081663 RepID=UPI00294A5B69|nr:histidine kinase [Flavobacterium sp. DG1-102-2]MDV6169460.1 histidine kinase [Flavobacterium sp. DG1-102-2]
MQKVKAIYCTENGFVDFLVEPKYRVYRHFTIWLYLILTLLDGGEAGEYNGNYYLYIRIMWMAYFLAMVYFNMYVLVPYQLFKGKYFTYIVTLTGLIVVTFSVMRQINIMYFDPHRILPKQIKLSFWREILAAANILTLTVFSSTAIKLFQQWKVDTTRMAELEKATLQMELKELKNQINPHFLFNMLNNVNVLVTKDPVKASLIIVKLSDFLRYQLYENNAASVQLSSEIQFLTDFMELEKIRRDDFTFELTVNNSEYDKDSFKSISLPPSLFICFIENAIKYSIDLDNPSYVKAGFTIVDDKLHFTCINSKAAEPLVLSESGGLGLANVKRRLELLYGKDFTLDIRNDEHEYEVNLILPL